MGKWRQRWSEQVWPRTSRRDGPSGHGARQGRAGQGRAHLSSLRGPSTRACSGISGFRNRRGSVSELSALGSYSSSPGLAKRSTYWAMPLYPVLGLRLRMVSLKGSGGSGANSSSSFFGSPVLCPLIPALSCRSCSSFATSAGFLRTHPFKCILWPALPDLQPGRRRGLTLKGAASLEYPRKDNLGELQQSPLAYWYCMCALMN